MKKGEIGGKIKVDVKSDGRIEVTAYLSGKFFKEDKMWVSHCPPLDLSTCGRTKKEVMENTKEAIIMFFESCLKRGTLEEALGKLKWTQEQSISLDGLTSPRRLTPLPLETPPAFVIENKWKDGWNGRVELR